jgi:hypothetical protein
MGVALDATVVMTFSEPVDCASMSAAFSLTGAVEGAVSGTVACSGNSATFTPTAMLDDDTPYTASVTSAATDAAGNALASPHSWSFTTRPRAWGTAQLLASGDGDAQLPRLAAAPDGSVLAVWMQPAGGGPISIWASRYSAVNGWGTPQLVESDDTGDAVLPQVAFSQGGDAIAVWQQHDGTRDNVWAAYYLAATGWSAPQLIENNGGQAGNAKVAFDQDGNAYAVWTQLEGANATIWSNRYAAGVGWGNAQSITSVAGSANVASIAADGSGNVLVVWGQYDGSRSSIWANGYTPAAGWGTSQRIDADVGNGYTPQIAFDGAGNALALWWQYEGATSHIWFNRYVAGSGWGTAARVENSPGGAHYPRVAFDPQGEAVAVWSQGDGGSEGIWSSRYTPGSGWGAAGRLDTGAGGAGQPRLAIDARGRALAVWHESDGAVLNMASNRYRPDAGWGTAQLIEQDDAGDAQYPELAIDGEGNATAVWMQYDGNFDNIVANRLE